MWPSASPGNTGNRSAGRVYLGLFHAISAFNNAGFSLFSDSLESYPTDAWVVVPILVALTIGGLGSRSWRNCSGTGAHPAAGHCTPR